MIPSLSGGDGDWNPGLVPHGLNRFRVTLGWLMGMASNPVHLVFKQGNSAAQLEAWEVESV